MANLQITAAVYGSKNKGKDVKTICQQMISNGNDDILVNADTMQGDPDIGVAKYFAIQYTIDGGLPQVRACKEGESVDLIPAPTPFPK